MTGEDPRRLSEQGRAEQCADAILRFAPNYSVYVLPPDLVCLYSEDRKLFLHGELYCALATRIGGGESQGSITRALSEAFPPEKIEQAFERLLDRRFVAPVGAGDGPSAAYWASLGLRPETAAENLQRIGVRIESLGIAGEAELAAALRAFGVRVDDGAADLTVVLIGDYLDARLAAINLRQLERRQDWLPVQPSGVFPLVGPIFSPGKSACWTCLADRMKWNRQVKAFLDRKNARCVSASPLADNLLGHSGVALAAVEIGKAIASGFRTDLHRHLVSLDLMGSTVVRHFVPARPQCPCCGSEELRDPARPPEPIRLRAGGRLVMTSGGYRSVSPSETVSRFRKHVSPLTGVVSRLDRIESEQPLDFSFLAKHNFSPSPESFDALQAGLAGDSFGKGGAAEQGEASALMEGIERYCGMFQGDEIRTARRLVDFPAGDAIAPNDILLFSDLQYERAAREGYCSDGVPHPFDPRIETEWTPVWSLRDERFKHIPTGLLYFFHGAPANNIIADSNGCAAGNTIEEAILQGFLELVERDAYAIWWYNRLRRPEIDLDALGDNYIRELKAHFDAMGRRLWALDVTSDLGVPVVVAVAHWVAEGQERIEVAAGAHFDVRIATLRALTEINQFMAIERLMGRPSDRIDPLPLREHPYLTPLGASQTRPGLGRFGNLDRREQVLSCAELVGGRGHDFLVLDQTRPDIEVPVVRVIVPGLRHFYRRFAPGRLYDAPVALGLRERPLLESELNPLHPIL